jgi:citrate synthase
VEFYAALALEAIGLPRELFTLAFAMGRVLGWTAFIFEQEQSGRLIGPASRYTRPLPDGRMATAIAG